MPAAALSRARPPPRCGARVCVGLCATTARLLVDDALHGLTVPYAPGRGRAPYARHQKARPLPVPRFVHQPQVESLRGRTRTIRRVAGVRHGRRGAFTLEGHHCRPGSDRRGGPHGGRRCPGRGGVEAPVPLGGPAGRAPSGCPFPIDAADAMPGHAQIDRPGTTHVRVELRDCLGGAPSPRPPRDRWMPVRRRGWPGPRPTPPAPRCFARSRTSGIWCRPASPRPAPPFPGTGQRRSAAREVPTCALRGAKVRRAQGKGAGAVAPVVERTGGGGDSHPSRRSADWGPRCGVGGWWGRGRGDQCATARRRRGPRASHQDCAPNLRRTGTGVEDVTCTASASREARRQYSAPSRRA